MSTDERSIAAPFEYVFPAIRGVQARREYYVSMCPLRLIPKLFLFNEEELIPELRAQRILNKGRIPEITRYIVDNRESYTFSAITASIDGDLRFDPLGTGADGRRIGLLHVPMDARFVINDGQHRRAAIEHAIRECPEIADESIAVVLFHDLGLERCQQMFADLNRHAIRPSTSLGVLYDHRDDDARLTKLALLRLPLFRDLTEMERSTLSARSRKLFTLSALYSANSALLARMEEDKGVEERRDLATAYWEEVSRHFPEWKLVHERQLTAAEVRRDLLHTHGVVLQAIGRAGNALLREQPKAWKSRLKILRKVDWSRSNAIWEGRALIGGKVSRHTNNVVLTTNLLKNRLGLPLTPEEQRVEDAFRRGEHASQ